MGANCCGTAQNQTQASNKNLTIDDFSRGRPKVISTDLPVSPTYSEEEGLQNLNGSILQKTPLKFSGRASVTSAEKLFNHSFKSEVNNYSSVPLTGMR